MKNRRKYLVDNKCAECGHGEFSYLLETVSQYSGCTTYDRATEKWEKSDMGEDAYLKAEMLYCKKCNQVHYYPEELR
jgi:uncharacterized OB-fold protein